MRKTFRNFRRVTLSLPRRRFKLRTEGLEAPAGRFGWTELVVSRALCRFQRFDLRSLPAPKRLSALRLQLQRWTPFRSAEYAVLWEGGLACVWAWAQPFQPGASKRGMPQRQLPETLLHPALTEGVRLVTCLDGFEAQFWLDGRLQQSRWWRTVPTSQQWMQFQRDCQVPAEEQLALPEPSRVTLESSPWAEPDLLGSGGDWAAWEPLLYATLVLLLGAPSVLFGVRIAQVQAALAEKDAELAMQRTRSAPVLKAREAALADLERLRAVRNSNALPEQLRVMAALAPIIAEGGAFLKEWDFADGKLKLQLGTSRPTIAGADFVKAMEQLELFADIKVVSSADSKTIGFSMRLLPIADSAAGAQAEGLS